MRVRGSRKAAIGLGCAATVAAAWPDRALAQVPALGKGHSYFVSNGLQIWGLDQGAAVFNYNNLAGANFNGVMWSWGQAGKVSQIDTAQNQRWGKWTDPNDHPSTALNALEQTKAATLMALQVGDEQQSDLENPNGVTKTWFQNAHTGNYFPNQLLYTNSFFINDDAAYANFIAQANPDAISFDSYPFDEPYGSVILPHNWLALAGRFRRHALSSYLTYNGNPIGSNAPRPYGLYLQTYAASEGPGKATRHPGDVEMRWQQFTAWTMGFTFVDAFTVGGSSSLFNNSNQNDISQPRYDQFKESARQGRNLGPALTRLISYGYGPSIVIGKDAAGNNNPVPSDWLPFQASNAPAGQQFLTSLSAANIGTKNNGQPGDLYVGFFNPLHASFGPAGETYFMVTNALGAYLDDETATVADTAQHVTINFDTQYSGVSTLQRLRRSDGQLEIVPLTRTSARLYQLQFNLEGGTGDLFKYNDGTPFVGVNNALYWDNDANAGNNNTGTGAGLGGAGTWDAAAGKWFNGSANAAWAGNRDAIFTGTGGAVTLATPQAVNSLQFKTNGYTLSGAAVTMAGQFINTDAGVTATITSDLAGTGGIAKSGPGTLIIGNANSYSGGTAVTGGVLQIGSDAALGAAPVSFTAGNVVLNGGTLRFAADVNLNNNRGIDIGASGGTIDTQSFSNATGYNATAGGFRGPGDLTKVGSGTFFAAATTGGANTTWKGRLILKEGTWKIVASDGLPYNVPLADGLKADQITFVGGTLQMGATINVTNARRGMTVGAGGGTIDTQGFNFAWAGPIAEAAFLAGAPTLTKIGSGMLTFTGAGTASTYGGRVNVDGGTLSLGGGIAMGDTAWITLANSAGVTLNVTGNETIGPLIGGGTTGGNVTLANGVTLTTAPIGAAHTFAGVISGGGGITKAGAGISRFSGANTYTGETTINAGTLRISAPNNLGNSSNSLVLDGGTLELLANMSLSRPLTVNAAGGAIKAPLQGGNFSGSGATTFNGNLAVSTGKVGFERFGGIVSVTPGATITVGVGTQLWLAGDVAALSDGVDHVNVVNDSTFPGLVVSLGASHAVGTISGVGKTQVDANSTLTATHVRQNTLTVNGGTMIIRPNGGPTGTSDLDTITLPFSGKLDLKDNKLVTKTAIGTASAGVYTGVQGMVQSAFNAGSWNGAGITTSMPGAASGLTSIGVATAAATGYAGGTFSGRSVDAGDILVMYTYAGDANLDGFISGDDYAAIDFNIATPAANGWVNGDFNWDGIVSGDDYTVIDFNVVAQGAPFSTAAGSLASASGTAPVPEPGIGLFVALAGPAMLLRRRRRDF